MLSPKTKERNLNNLLLQWNKISNDVIIINYQLEICTDWKEWKILYCGNKCKFKVENLAPCTYYNFRIRATNYLDWEYFKAATEDCGPFTSVMHMTRAIKLKKTAIVRKIAQISPFLLNAENKEHKTPIIQAIEAQDLQMLQLLIILGANVNKPLKFSLRTPLMIAIFRGELQAATFLIEKGAQLMSKDINGLNIFHYAVDSNKLDNVKYVFEKTELDINIQDNSGWTALLRAVILQCQQEIIDFLILNGANTQITDNNRFDYYKHLNILNCIQ